MGMLESAETQQGLSGRYGHNKKWRDNNRKIFEEGKKRNYSKSRPNARNSRQMWVGADDILILAKDRPSDFELSKKIGRSVQAIQIRRSVISKLDA
jgi:hypothetical protein